MASYGQSLTTPHQYHFNNQEKIMAKKVFYDDDARRRLLAGAKILYDAVKTTMGPKGRNVVIGHTYGLPTVTHDGVTVAKGVELGDVDDETLGYRVGAELIKGAASKMNDDVGDGTTTVTVLTYHILREANRLIAAGHNPMLLRKGLEAAAHEALEQLDGMREDISGNKKRIAAVATISAGDPEIGELIAEVMSKTGKDGLVTVEEGQSLSLEKEIVEGYTLNRGFVSPYMVTDPDRLEAIHEKPAIVITDRKVNSIQEILPLIELIANGGKKSMVLIAEEVGGDALPSFVLNHAKGVFHTVAVKAPSFGSQRKEILEDIASLTGAKVISQDQGHTFKKATLDMVGTARQVIVGRKETTIIEGSGTAESLEARIKQLTAQIKEAPGEYEADQLEKRRAALSGKVAIIKVGGASETEIEEKKYRVDDAVAAVKAALADGIVPGGGVTLVNLTAAITSDGDATVSAGKQILRSVLERPFRILLKNAGLNPDEWLPKLLAAKPGYGIDVNGPGQLVDLKAAGVIDPARATKEALQNAVSIAGTGMTMGALVVEIPEKPVANETTMGM